ncbi:CBO0543 family protein [Anaeroselena agilis]|uniref:CBO0543 family protein n=1 Tax=Anaeroselena agilis TaxID=3063788 RepID=A0ABU3NYY1_9FIRM|nr:CBO0543 family protein [Selenomonadales bacterium 4137-cl]
MTREYWVIDALALMSVLLLAAAARISGTRVALFAFLAAQAISWPTTILLVCKGSIVSPVRLFPAATDSNLIMAFVFVPAAFAAHYTYYPLHAGRLVRMVFTLTVTGAVALVHVAVHHYTALLDYIDFSGYWLWLITLALFYALRIYSDWYFSHFARLRAGNQQ